MIKYTTPPEVEKNYAGPYKPWGQLTSIRDLRAGDLYIIYTYHYDNAAPNHIACNATLAKITCIEEDRFDYRNADPYTLKFGVHGLNNFEFCVWDDAILQHPAQKHGYYAFLIYSTHPVPYCPCCHSEDWSIIEAVQVQHGQRIGRSTMYNRCLDCRYIWRDERRTLSQINWEIMR